MFSVANRIIKQITHDKRSMALLIIAPILLLTLIYLLLGESGYKPTVVLDIDAFPTSIKDILYENLSKSEEIELSLLPKGSDPKKYVESGKYDTVITLKDDDVELVMLELESTKLSTIQDAIQNALPLPPHSLKLNIKIIHGTQHETTFDSLAYYFLSVLAFFLIFIFAGISFVRERTGGTLERLMRTPVKSISVVAGYTLGFGLFAILQSLMLILYAKFILDTLFIGVWWHALIFMFLIAIIAVLLGIFVSVISKSEFQIVQFIPIIIVPQMFFSGLIPIDTLPYNLNYISYFMPLYYSGMGLKYVMVFGYGLDKVILYIFVLLGIICFLFIVNIIVVEKSRRT